MSDFAKAMLETARRIQEEVNQLTNPPPEIQYPKTHRVVGKTLMNKAVTPLKRVANQVNGCYEQGWFDGSTVMIRRLIETLIIEVFHYRQMETKIQQNGEYLYLEALINITLAETSLNLTRGTKKALKELKAIGDQSAHSRRYNANREDIEPLLPHIRTAVEELLVLANMR